MRIYAYVTTECCRSRHAVKPGTLFYGYRPVSKHGDYSAWPYGKRETLQLTNHTSPYIRQSAVAVAHLLNWL